MANKQLGSPEWARFEDWLSDNLGRYNDWTVVAEIATVKDKVFVERRSIMSYLIGDKKDLVAKALRHDAWNKKYVGSNIFIEETDSGLICHEKLGNDDESFFITFKDKIGSHPACWKLWPTFINYFDLRNDKNGNLIDPYNRELIVEIPNSVDEGPVRVRTDYLQDYLAARSMVLIRQHDHRRFWSESINGFSKDEDSGVCNKDWGCYRLVIANSKKSIKLYSRLTAKDLITPYKHAGSVGKYRDETRKTDYPKFIVNKDINGREIEKKPHPDASEFVYFNPKVLKRYYDEPSRYEVGFHAPGLGGVSFSNQWSIHIGRSSEGLIIVWLAHLSELPDEEMAHWRTHNVAPRGDVSEDFWNAQMMCEPPKHPSLENRLIECRYLIKKVIEVKGKKIYKPYSGPDIDIEKTLHIPLFDEHEEFVINIISLSKMFIECLDKKAFCNDLDDIYVNNKDGKEIRPIVIFSNWLIHEIGVSENIAESIKKSLQNIQMVRSKTGVAHRFSDNSYKKVINKLGLSGRVTAKSLFCSVAEPLADNFENLCKELNVENNLWWIKKSIS